MADSLFLKLADISVPLGELLDIVFSWPIIPAGCGGLFQNHAAGPLTMEFLFNGVPTQSYHLARPMEMGEEITLIVGPWFIKDGIIVEGDVTGRISELRLAELPHKIRMVNATWRER